jgi:type VI secretion system protein ImpD
VHAPDDVELPGGSPAAGRSRKKASAAGLLDEVIAAAQRPAAGPGAFRLEDFLTDSAPGAALRRWFRVPSSARFNYSRDQVVDRLHRDIAELDVKLTDQLNAILHHPKFQQLEASWRGLRYLTDQAAGLRDVKLRVLNLSWLELSRDLQRAIEFDQSQFFSKVYSEEFGSPGGEPFGVILGDYEVSHRVSPDHPHDLDALESLAHVAAAAFAPMIMGAHPTLFGLDDYAALGTPLNLPRTFQQLEYLRWHRIRDTEDARFVGLVLPHVLMLLPYQDEELRSTGFRFSEQVAGPDNRDYLWGSAVYALGAVLLREFAQSGWLAAIQGVERGVEAGGLVTGLPQHDFGTDVQNLVPKYSTDVMITDRE